MYFRAICSLRTVQSKLERYMALKAMSYLLIIYTTNQLVHLNVDNHTVLNRKCMKLLNYLDFLRLRLNTIL